MRKLITLVVLAVLAGCSDSTGPGAGHVGTYSLRTVNGDGLPVVLFQIGTDKIEVTRGSVTLNADRTFSDRTTFRTTESGAVSTDEVIIQGTYTVNSNAIQLAATDGSQYSMSLSGSTLTQTMDQFVLVYRK